MVEEGQELTTNMRRSLTKRVGMKTNNALLEVVEEREVDLEEEETIEGRENVGWARRRVAVGLGEMEATVEGYLKAHVEGGLSRVGDPE